jgi:transposase
MGSTGVHQRCMVRSQLRLVEPMQAEIDYINQQFEERMRPFDTQLALLDQIPGIGKTSAQLIVAEIGVDVSRLGSADHLASLARVCLVRILASAASPGSVRSLGSLGD